MPVEAHIKEHPAYFHRFDALWTPTVLIMDSDGKERWRIEGYLPKTEFRAQLELGLARVDFMQKHWSEAERRYAAIAERYPETFASPEAIYWRVISRYKATNDHNVLVVAAEELSQKYPSSEWAVRASVFTH